jgi:universal stress protein A
MTNTADRRTWLVATDFSPCADAALRLAWQDLAAFGGGRVILCHVYSVLEPPGGFGGGVPPYNVADLQQGAKEAVTRQLKTQVEAVRQTLSPSVADHKEVKVETVTRQDTPVDGLLAEVTRAGAERLVVGTHGRTGLAHVLLGSVAARLARLSLVPVLVVKES